MKTIKYIASLAMVPLFMFMTPSDPPIGWFKAGSKPDKYEMGIDQAVSRDGESSAFIVSRSGKVNGFGTLMQTCSAGKYLNQRIKMTGYLKS